MVSLFQKYRFLLIQFTKQLHSFDASYEAQFFSSCAPLTITNQLQKPIPSFIINTVQATLLSLDLVQGLLNVSQQVVGLLDTHRHSD